MNKLLYPIAFTLTAFLIFYSCSAEEEDTTPPPALVQPQEPEPTAPTQYTLLLQLVKEELYLQKEELMMKGQM